MKQLSETRWYGTAFCLAVLALIAKALMTLAAFFLPEIGVDRPPEQSEQMYRSYRMASLFSVEAAKVKPVAAKQQPVYRLDKLTLRGIYAGKNPFIAVEEGGKVILIAQDESHKGYRLVEVASERAIFEKGGRRYEIGFKEDKSADSRISKVKTPEVLNEGGAVFIKRDEISHYAKNFDDIWKSVKIEPVKRNGKLDGFKVNWVKKGSVFEKIGLRKGDIIIGANDRDFTSLSQVFKLYNNVDKIDRLKLKILRENQEMELEYEIF